MILITGGAGFIGSNLLAGLDRNGQHNVTICDTLGHDEKWKNLAKHYIDNLIDPTQLDDWLSRHQGKVDVIFHLGAISSTTETDADLIADSNFRLSRKLWQYCAAHNTRLIYASSAATYGDGEAGFLDDDSTEALAKLRPLNAYGWSKQAFDRFAVQQKAQQKPCPKQWVGLKFFNVYGPNEYHKGEQQSVIARQFERIAAGAPARLFKSYKPEYPDGGQKRDFVWVGDVVDVMLWFAAHPDKSGIYNVGNGEARSFADLAKAIFAALGKPARIDFIEMPESLKDKYQYYTEANISKLRGIGYSHPMTSLEDGVAIYVQQFLNATDPYR